MTARLLIIAAALAAVACAHNSVVSPSPTPQVPTPAPVTPAPTAPPPAPPVVTITAPQLSVSGPAAGCIELIGGPGTWSVLVQDAGSEPLTLSATIAGPAAPGCQNIPDLPAPVLLPPSAGPTSYAPSSSGTTTFTSPLTCGLYRVRIEGQRGAERLPLVDVVVDTRRYCGR